MRIRATGGEGRWKRVRRGSGREFKEGEGRRGAGKVYIANRGCDNHNTDLSEGLSVASLWLYTVTMKQETVLMPRILNLFLRSKK